MQYSDITWSDYTQHGDSRAKTDVKVSADLILKGRSKMYQPQPQQQQEQQQQRQQ